MKAYVIITMNQKGRFQVAFESYSLIDVAWHVQELSAEDYPIIYVINTIAREAESISFAIGYDTKENIEAFKSFYDKMEV